MRTHNLIKLALTTLALVACAFASAQSAAGKWNGKIDLSAAKPKDANEKAQIDMAKKMMATMVIKLDMKSDKSYTITFSGTFQGKPQSSNEKGTWSQKGHTVTTVDPKGKKNSMIVSANGKTMEMVPTPEDHMPKGVRMTFTRA